MPRTCEQNLQKRAWASARCRRCQLVDLLTQPTIRQVYARLARRALESGKPQEIAEALAALQQEMERCRGIAQRLAA